MDRVVVGMSGCAREEQCFVIEKTSMLGEVFAIMTWRMLAMVSRCFGYFLTAILQIVTKRFISYEISTVPTNSRRNTLWVGNECLAACCLGKQNIGQFPNTVAIEF